MDKKKITKIIISIFLFLLGTLGSLFASSYLHLFLTKGLSSINILDILQVVGILTSDKKAMNIFMVLELGVIVLSIFYYFMKDNFYESELITITPKIKIPVPAGQMQFGSARFINDEEMSNLFTICEVNPKDRLMKYLIEFGNKEYKGIRKVIKEDIVEGVEKIEKANALELEKIEEVDVEYMKMEDTKVEKVYKYRIQEEINLFLEDDIPSLNYFNKEIDIIDKIIYLEKKSRYETVKEKIRLMPNGDDKDKLLERLKEFLNVCSIEIEEEIDKVENQETKEHLNKLLNIFYKEFNDKQKEYTKNIELDLKLIEEISEETDLNKYMEITKILEKRIDKLPNSENKTELFNKLFDLMDKIILENNRKYEEIEKMLW